MLNTYLNLSLKGYHTPRVPSCFLSSADVWGIRLRKRKGTLRGQTSVRRGERGGSWVLYVCWAWPKTATCFYVVPWSNQGKVTKAAREKEWKEEGVSGRQRKGLLINVAAKSSEMERNLPVWWQKAISVKKWDPVWYPTLTERPP